MKSKFGGDRGVATHEVAHHKNERYEKAAKTFTEFNNALVQMLTDAGVINQDSATKIQESWETYIPLMRVRDSVNVKAWAEGSC